MRDDHSYRSMNKALTEARNLGIAPRDYTDGGRYSYVLYGHSETTTGPNGTGKRATGRLAVYDPQGSEVHSFDIHSGGGYFGRNKPTLRDYLPGMMGNTPAKYAIGAYCENPGNAAMRYTDPSATSDRDGFWIPLRNPSNMKEIGGKGRGSFGFHPNGGNNTSAGCIEFGTDTQAAEFQQLHKGLVKQGKAPKHLTVGVAETRGSLVAGLGFSEASRATNHAPSPSPKHVAAADFDYLTRGGN